METTMNYRGIVRYSFTYTKPSIFSRLVRFLRAALETKPANPCGLSNAMAARMYL